MSDPFPLTPAAEYYKMVADKQQALLELLKDLPYQIHALVVLRHLQIRFEMDDAFKGLIDSILFHEFSHPIHTTAALMMAVKEHVNGLS